MTNAMLEPPMHPGKKLKCFANEHNHDQTSCAE